MTNPGPTPSDPEPGTQTEPVPPIAAPHASIAAEPPAAPAAPVPAFTPAAPEPVPPQVAAQKPAASSSRFMTLALGAAVLVAAMGISFAAGRASAPDTASPAAAAGVPGGPNAGVPGAPNAGVPGGGNRSGGTQRGAGPDQQFDLNGPGGDADDNGGFFGGGRGVPQDGDGRGFGGFEWPQLQGTVQSVTPDSITITTSNGATVTVGLDSTTTYHQETAAAASDVTPGSKVELQVSGQFDRGSTAGDGSGTVKLGTASDVTIVP